MRFLWKHVVEHVRLRSTHLYPRPFPFKDLSPCEQSLSFPHLSLDMSGLPSYWRCTCVHTHAFHITHDRNQQQAFLGDPSLRRCQWAPVSGLGWCQALRLTLPPITECNEDSRQGTPSTSYSPAPAIEGPRENHADIPYHFSSTPRLSVSNLFLSPIALRTC